MTIDTLRVSASTEVKKLANAIMQALANSGQCEMICIGPASVNQAVKGLASANGLASTSGHILRTTPFFRVLDLDGNEQRTAMVFLVTRHNIGE